MRSIRSPVAFHIIENLYKEINMESYIFTVLAM
jgi:hypothetical protein